MIKLLSAVAVLLFTTLAGYQKARAYADRVRHLRQLQTAMQQLETEIVYAGTPLDQAMGQIAHRIHGPIGELFSEMADALGNGDGLSVTACWNRTMDRLWHKTSLKETEKEILQTFGQTLGLTDKEDQQKHLRLTMSKLKSEEDGARLEREKYEKMCKSLGFIGGLLIVILMY